MSPPFGAVEFVKGHGTENDFVLLPDPDGRLELTPERARAICDRHAGLGADGVIRVAREADGGFFMDYRNADGSLAEMCGNGARVFARYLVDAGWQRPGRFDILTRGGVRTVDVPDSGDVAVAMGPVTVGASSFAHISGEDLPGTVVDVGNPHLVCRVEDEAVLDLGRAPGFDPAVFPQGVNVEFYRPVGADAVRMRVYERGSGETRSCGTGTVAVAAVWLHALGQSEGELTVQVPGGAVRVRLDRGADTGPAFSSATLTGPTAFVAQGHLDPSFWP